jgi:hypothetical protein
MDTTKTWRLGIHIDEHDDQTHARAHLVTKDSELTGLGIARLNPRDTDVPEIGDELAVARALSDLAHQLLEAAAGDIESVTHQRGAISL